MLVEGGKKLVRGIKKWLKCYYYASVVYELRITAVVHELMVIEVVSSIKVGGNKIFFFKNPT